MSKSLKLPTAIAKRLTVILLAASVLVLIGGGIGFYLLQSKQAEADKLVAEKQAQVGSNEEITRRYQATLDSYNATMEQLKYLEPSMTSKDYVPTLVQQLQKMSTDDHLKVTDVRPSAIVEAAPPKAPDNGDPNAPKPAAPSYKTMNVQLSVEGTYSQIMAFIYHMTKFQKIVAVQSLQFSPRGSAPGTVATSQSPLMGADIGLTTYIFEDSANPAALPGTPGVTLTSVLNYADNGNPIATAASHMVTVTRNGMQNASVRERTQGLLEPAASGNHTK